MSGVRRALAMSLLERYLVLVLSLASNIILARLLTPEQIGIYSVSLAVIGIAQVLRDFGVGNYLIQEKDLTPMQLRTAFGISLLLGTVLCAVVFAAAPWVADYYDEPRMVRTLRICSLNFLLLPFCSISLALLRREMLFGRLLYVSLATAATNFAVTLGLAAMGFGPDSMAIGAVASNIATGLSAHFARGSPALLMPSLAEWRRLVNFGGQSALTSVVTTVSIDINDLVLGKVLGFAPVAILSRAQGLMNMFHRDLMGAIRNVAYPAFARAHREGEALEPQYVKSASLVCLIGWPFYGFIALFALESLRLLFGAQWDEAAPLVPWFCLAGAFACVASLTNTVMMAAGRIEMVTRGELIYQPFRAGIIVATVVTTHSLLACAMAFALGYLLYIPFIYRLKQRCLPNDWKALTGGLWASAKVCLCTMLGPLVIAAATHTGRAEPIAWPLFALAIAVGVAGWLLGVHFVRHPIVEDPAYRRIMSWRPRWR